MAARRERGLFDPDAAAGESPFDHFVYVICCDGDLQEGVSAEASSLAGHQQLGNLVVIYDDNQISIEDDTDIAFTEDVAARYEAYGWHVQDVDWTGGKGPTDPSTSRTSQALHAAIEAAKAVTDKPELHHPAHDHRLAGARPSRTPARPTAPRSAPTRSPPPRRCSASTPSRPSRSPTRSSRTPAALVERGKAARGRVAGAVRRVGRGQPRARRRCFDRTDDRARCPPAGTTALPSFDADAKGVATRAASGKVLNALAAALPELWGGSADLAESNNTTIKGAPSFIPAERSTHEFAATRTAACCTSASASTPWARS